jgi:hypothetical protein
VIIPASVPSWPPAIMTTIEIAIMAVMVLGRLYKPQFPPLYNEGLDKVMS